MEKTAPETSSYTFSTTAKRPIYRHCKLCAGSGRIHGSQRVSGPYRYTTDTYTHYDLLCSDCNGLGYLETDLFFIDK